jgi:hypothetical protein
VPGTVVGEGDELIGWLEAQRCGLKSDGLWWGGVLQRSNGTQQGQGAMLKALKLCRFPGRPLRTAIRLNFGSPIDHAVTGARWLPVAMAVVHIGPVKYIMRG